jgi:hypothetical protein
VVIDLRDEDGPLGLVQVEVRTGDLTRTLGEAHLVPQLGGHGAVSLTHVTEAESCSGHRHGSTLVRRRGPTAGPYASWSRRRLRYAISAVLPASSMARSYAARELAVRPSRRSRSARVAWKAW